MNEGPWNEVADAWRRGQEGLETGVPFGFATRVVARWQEMREQEWVRRWESLSLRGAGVAAGVAVLCAGYVQMDSGGLLPASGEDRSLLVPSVELTVNPWDA